MRTGTSAAACGVALALAGLLAGCAASRANARLGADDCHFTVLNRTGGPLAIRHIKGRSAIEIGAINPNEQVSATTACAEEVAYVWGSPIPLQVGAPPASPPVFGAVELIPGVRTSLSLYWP